MSEAIVIITPAAAPNPVRIEIKYPNELPARISGPLSIGDERTRIKFESASGTSTLSMTSSIDPEEGGDPIIAGLEIEANTDAPGQANAMVTMAGQQVMRILEADPASDEPHVRFYRPVRGVPAVTGNQFVLLEQVAIPYTESKVVFLTPDEVQYTFTHNKPLPYIIALEPMTQGSAASHWISDKRDNEFDVTFAVAPTGAPLVYDMTVTPLIP